MPNPARTSKEMYVVSQDRQTRSLLDEKWVECAVTSKQSTDS